MKAYVITIMDLPESVEIAKRCIESAKKFGLEVVHYSAVTPADKPLDTMAKIGIPTQTFDERWSFTEKAAAAFLSHYNLWNEAAIREENVLVFEHDAVVRAPIPIVPFKGLLSYGFPSYGKYRTPSILGVNPLTSKTYLPGAHAYLVKPGAAKVIMDHARIAAQPTDVFLNIENFPWIEEYYPWPVIAEDSFTTIQNELGIRAKHNFRKGIKIL